MGKALIGFVQQQYKMTVHITDFDEKEIANILINILLHLCVYVCVCVCVCVHVRVYVHECLNVPDRARWIYFIISW